MNPLLPALLLRLLSTVVFLVAIIAAFVFGDYERGIYGVLVAAYIRLIVIDEWGSR